jgi:hypothetical protein
VAAARRDNQISAGARTTVFEQPDDRDRLLHAVNKNGARYDILYSPVSRRRLIGTSSDQPTLNGSVRLTVHSASSQCQLTVPAHSASSQCQLTVPAHRDTHDVEASSRQLRSQRSPLPTVKREIRPFPMKKEPAPFFPHGRRASGGANLCKRAAPGVACSTKGGNDLRFPFPQDCTALVLGQPLINLQPDAPANQEKKPLPIAWTKTWTGSSGRPARIFHFTMGSAEDFQNAGVRRLTVNAVYWGLGMEDEIQPDRSVEFIGDYQPLKA